MAQWLTERLVTVHHDNRPGAGTNIAAEVVVIGSYGYSAFFR